MCRGIAKAGKAWRSVIVRNMQKQTNKNKTKQNENRTDWYL